MITITEAPNFNMNNFPFDIPKLRIENEEGYYYNDFTDTATMVVGRTATDDTIKKVIFSNDNQNTIAVTLTNNFVPENVYYFYWG